MSAPSEPWRGHSAGRIDSTIDTRQSDLTTLARLRVASIASTSSHSANPRFAMSFIKNSPSADNTGKPPAEASPTPGVVTMKLSVITKNSDANTPPTTETLGNHGLTASSAATINSIDPFSRPKSSIDITLYIQLKNGLFATQCEIPWDS